ncbi:MAG: cell division ATP-binding protein FtsE [Acidobacteria bacterium]|nr:cell division ATP-binding protein FtsE [Acidobacteriota bacterium]
MIHFFHVSKVYEKGNRALHEVNVSIGKGEFVFLTGPSGAGKTTFLKLIFREELPSYGRVVANNQNTIALGKRRIPDFRKKIGVVFQDFKLLENRTVFENIVFILNVLGYPASFLRDRAFYVLKLVGLQHRYDDYPRQLSGGEQQRIAIARALVNEPLILLADEPTGNLDPDLSLEIMALFEKINSRGTTVLIATHDREMIKQMRKRTLYLDHGHLQEHRK